MENKERMSLDSIIKGRITSPITVLLYGPEGIGKSTFGADAPTPIFIDAEKSSEELDVERFPIPEAWQDVKCAVRHLTVDNHKYKTLVVDTVDWLEHLIWEYVCKRDGKANIEEYGYGRGYIVAADEWRVFLADLERLATAKGMNIVLLAHSCIKTFKSPDSEDYDRYELKVHLKASGLLREWPKEVLFANYETLALKDAKTKRVKGISTGARWIYTTRTAAYDAKNRHKLPERIPLSWADFYAGVQAGSPASVEAIIAEIQEKAGRLGGDQGKQALEAIERAKGEVEKLAKLNNWCNCRLTEIEQAHAA